MHERINIYLYKSTRPERVRRNMVHRQKLAFPIVDPVSSQFLL